MRIAWTVMTAPEPIAALTVGVSDAGLAWLSFGRDVEGLVTAARRIGADPVPDSVRTAPFVRRIGEYLDGRQRAVDVPVDWCCTAGAQRAVLQTLYRTVGYGETVTYGVLAARSGAFATGEQPGQAARAVGSIMGSNPVPVVVPCHRVLAADGLGGFGGGLAVKRWLLELEGVLTPGLDFGSRVEAQGPGSGGRGTQPRPSSRPSSSRSTSR